MKKFGICKYDINGKHYILSNEGNLMIFDSPVTALYYLTEKDLPKEIIMDLQIEELTEEELNDIYVKEK